MRNKLTDLQQVMLLGMFLMTCLLKFMRGNNQASS